MSKILVCAKVDPDLDGTACTLAYSYLLNKKGIKSDGIVFGSPQTEVDYFREIHKIQIPTYGNDINNNWGNFVLVDASSMKGVPNAVKPEKVIEIIDHRASEPEKEFPGAKIQNELIGAAATIVVERFIKGKLQPTTDHAKLLYGAIFHNTLNLISSNTTKRDKEVILYLEKKCGLKRNLIEEMFEYSTTKIENDPIRALEKDAKEFGEGNEISAFQIIVWSDNILKNKKEMEDCIERLRIKTKAKSRWAILNVIVLGTKQEFLYVSNPAGRRIVSKALHTLFDEDGWTQLSNILLRKQIVPLILKDSISVI